MAPPLGDQAYEILRTEIVNGGLAAGQRITERSLAERLGVSPTPVREALQRLEHEGLVERPNRRYLRVVKPSVRALYELTLIEGALRGVAARLAAEVATDAELAAIETAWRRSAEAVDGPPAARMKHTRRLHELIDKASHNEVLVGMIATAVAFDWSHRLRVMESAKEARHLAGAGHEHHGRIVEALLARDGDRAEAEMRHHISSTRRVFLDLLERDEAG